MRCVHVICFVLMVCHARYCAAGAPEPVPAGKITQRDQVLTLERATALAVANSPLIGQARARVDQAQGLAIQAGLYPNPIQNSGNPVQLGGNNGLYSVGFSQEIVRAGKIELNRSAAEQALRQAELEFIRQQFEVITSVRQEFFRLLAAQQKVRTLQELQAIAKRSEETSIRLLKHEQGTRIDVLQLRVELRRVEVQLRGAIQCAGSAQQLAALIGLPNLAIEGVIGDLSLKLSNFNDLQIRNDLLARSSLVESARVDIARTQFLLRRAEVEPIPNLTVNSGYQYATAGTHSQALVGLYFVMPIWDRNQGNIRAATANVRSSVAQLSAVQNAILRQVAAALAAYRAAEITVESYENGILPDARETLGLVQRGYEAQQFDYLRILQAQRSMVETNVEYINALQERLVAAADIAGLLQLYDFP